MILVFSEYSDLSTRQVLRYLNYHDEIFETFFDDDFIELHYEFSEDIEKFDVYKNNMFVCSSSDIKSTWYRRGDVKITRLSLNHGELDFWNVSLNCRPS